jgi:hypothetical protein
LIELCFDAVRCLPAFDDGLHHGVGVLAQRRVSQQFDKAADAEHVAPQ